MLSFNLIARLVSNYLHILYTNIYIYIYHTLVSLIGSEVAFGQIFTVTHCYVRNR